MDYILPTYETVVALHGIALTVSAGKSGIIHPNVIKSAIERPITYSQYGDDFTIHSACAILIDSLARGHSFADGNKRTAIYTCLFTYQLNGYEFINSDLFNAEIENLVLWVVNDKPEIKLIAHALSKMVSEFSAK